LKQIGLAMHNYHDVFGRFPAESMMVYNPTSDPALGARAPRNFSWIAAILPYMDQAPVYSQINFGIPAWNQNIGGKLLQSYTFPVTTCPSDGGFATAIPRQLGFSSYGIAEGWDWWNRGVDMRLAGVGVPGNYTTIAMIVDGTSNTLMIGETDTSNNTGSQFCCTRKRAQAERLFRTCLLSTQQNSDAQNLASSVFGSGGKFLDPDGGTVSSGGWWQGAPYALAPFYISAYAINSEWPGPASPHVGGAHFLLCDGSVRFVSGNIHHNGNWTISVWQAINSINGQPDQLTVTGDF